MSDILLGSVTNVLGLLVEQTVERIGEEDQANVDVQSIVLAGAIKTGDRWVNFGLQADEKSGLSQIRHFVTEDKGEFSKGIYGTVEDYFNSVSTGVVETTETADSVTMKF